MMLRHDKKAPVHTGRLLSVLVAVIFVILLSVNVLDGDKGGKVPASNQSEAPATEAELDDAPTEGSPVNLDVWEQVAAKERQPADAGEASQQATLDFGTPDQEHAHDSFAKFEDKEAEERYRASVDVLQGTVVFTLRDWREEGASAVYLDDSSELAQQFDLMNVEMVLEVRSKAAGERDGLEAYDVYYQANASAENKEAVWALVDELTAHDDVVSAEPDFVWQTQAVAQPTLAEFKTSRNWSDVLDIESVWSSVTDDYAGKAPGEGVVVAVIDTGVDYTHPDLDDNMWINTGEIPGNGIDDDYNGYVDDVYGIDLIEDDCDPMNDHGHGTHVAGIIAMEANGQGGVGVAYGAKVMAIKAGQPTGSFASTDIAKAVKYAADNGADVINMSFGGSGKSSLVEAALEDAFGSCVLVASAGNEREHTFEPEILEGEDCYPAAYAYVVGVMASYADGGLVAPFSNWDINPQLHGEYELVAPGVSIYSTLPGGRYAAWSGTSMAAPIVAATAALVRSEYPNKVVYSSRYVAGQLVSATQQICTKKTIDGLTYVYPLLNPVESLTLQPKPKLTFDDIVLFDSASISEKNNGDHIVQAGETIDFGVVVRNRWGFAKDVVLTADATSEGGVDNPHVEILQDTVNIQDIGTFMTANNDLIYDDGLLIDAGKPIRVRVSEDAPNDLQVRINFHVTARNGLDEADDKTYTVDSSYTFVVQKGEKIEGTLTEDTVLSSNRFWIINSDLYIPSGITLTIEPGTQLQVNMFARIYVGGRLIAAGTRDNPIEFDTTEAVYADERFITIRDDPNKEGFINDDNYDDAYVELRYVIGATHLCCATVIDHCRFVQRCYKLLANSISNSSFDAVANMNSGYPPYSDTEESYFYYGPTEILCNRFDDGYVHASTFNASGNVFKRYSSVYVHQSDSELHNNALLTTMTHTIQGRSEETTDGASPLTFDISNNYWGTQNTDLIDENILDKKDWIFGDELVYEPILSLSSPELETIYPFVTEAYVTDLEDNRLDVVAGEQAIRLHVKFNRDMASTVQPLVTFGGSEPYTDYVVTGDWEDAREWVGNIVITPFVSQGTQYIRVKDAAAADDTWLLTGTDAARFNFTITTNSTASLTLQGAGAAGCNELTWTQDDYDTLAGYNLYRSTDYDPSVSLDEQTFTRVNSSLIVADESDGAATIVEYKDSDVEVGTEYSYYFTVVDTAFNESEPSNVVTCTPLDGEAPVIEHQPPENISLGSTGIIVASVNDNVAVSDVSLHYRMAGADAWSTSVMRNTTGSVYRIVIAAYELGVGELEYWIEATDGVNVSTFGTEGDPVCVTVLDPNAPKDISVGTVSPISQQTYTGEALEPPVEVTLGVTTLATGTDYELSYADNVECGTATVTVTGTGNYTGELVTTFQIVEPPKTDISSAAFSAIGACVYDGTAQEPEVVLTLDGTELHIGEDYDLTYMDNVNVGTATIVVVGKGGYEGTATRSFELVPANITDASFSAIDTQTYTGLPLEPHIDVMLGNLALVAGDDYNLTYADNVNAGTATVTATGKGNLSGTKELTFAIGPADLSHATMREIPDQAYTGMANEPEVSLAMFGTSLLPGIDYDVSYENNVNAGAALVTVVGKGNFTGTKHATFGILPVSLDLATFEGGEDQVYAGTPAETTITLSYGG